MSDEQPHQITHLLHALQDARADGAARERLYGLVYAELHRIATRMMRKERPGHTLQPTALVHEAYFKLIGSEDVAWNDRAHFFGVAARAMRQVLIDHARRRAAEKRGGDLARVTLGDSIGDAENNELEVIALNDALERFSQVDERAARVVEMRVFTGLKMDEIAHVLDVSRRTVYDDWDVAKRWLGREVFGAEG